MSVSKRGAPSDGDAERWRTIRYALDSTPRVLRLCLITMAAGVLWL